MILRDKQTHTVDRNRPILRMLAAFAGVALIITGCTHTPISRADRQPDRLAPAAAERKALSPSRETFAFSRVTPLEEGDDALIERLRLIDSAKHQLDISAFIIRQDHAGFLFVDRVLKAANRGVRTRLLVDDLFNRTTAGRLMVLDHHPNIEIRIFNPFSRFSTTSMGYVLEFNRVSRRKHSRVMIADHARAILGGRNIGDEYFRHNGQSEFIDFDILVEGRQIASWTKVFEAYWSDPWSIPVTKYPSDDHADRFATLTPMITQRAAQAQAEAYPDLLKGDLQLIPRQLRRFNVRTALIADPPHKLRREPEDGLFVVASHHLRAIADARKEVVIITPYFIPETYGADVLARAAGKGVNVTVLTNSLASTNHVPVHGGYAPSRDKLLAAGVKIFELHPWVQTPDGHKRIRQTLHSKLTVIDRRETIVTTMNFDPVSVKSNAESSVVIRDQAFSKWVLKQANPIASGQSYQVVRTPTGALEWHVPGPIKAKTRTSEPGANGYRRFGASLVQLLGLGNMF